MGKFGSNIRKPGIYIFTHKISGKKYVGSSNSLARRLEQYFSPEHLFSQLNYGIFLPFLKAEGIGAFTLEVFIMPPKFTHEHYFLFLEQYYLLHSSFDLNSYRVVNFRVNQGNAVYMYDKEGKILYYSSKSIRQMTDESFGGISRITFMAHVDKDSYYIGHFKFSRVPLEGAVPSGWDISQLASFISSTKREFRKEIFLKADGNKVNSSVPVKMKEIDSGDINNFPSLKACAEFLGTKLDKKIWPQSIVKYLNTDKPFHGFIITKDESR